MKRIYAIEELCLDCKRCEIWCKTSHSAAGCANWRSQESPEMNPFDIIKAYAETEPEPFNRVHIQGTTLASLAMNCRHCSNPKCVEACICGAMQKDPETGVVFSDPERCVGCRTCMSVCPFGAVEIHSVALKCDLCGDGAGTPGTPACVASCPNRALIYVDCEA